MASYELERHPRVLNSNILGLDWSGHSGLLSNVSEGSRTKIMALPGVQAVVRLYGQWDTALS